MGSRNVALIRSRWHAAIVDSACDSFIKEYDQLEPEARIDVIDVPGAFEMPLLARRLGRSGKYAAIVAAALVVDGGIYRHDFVAQAVIDGLMRAQFDSDLPIFSLSLTPHHFQPTEEHEEFFREHFWKKGVEVARAVSTILRLPNDE